jgi:hypothetical protein
MTARRHFEQDKVCANAACVWVDALPFMRRARLARLLCSQEVEVKCAAKRRAKHVHDRYALLLHEHIHATIYTLCQYMP